MGTVSLGYCLFVYFCPVKLVSNMEMTAFGSCHCSIEHVIQEAQSPVMGEMQYQVPHCTPTLQTHHWLLLFALFPIRTSS